MLIRYFDPDKCIILVDKVPDDLRRGDILEGGHRVVAIISEHKICINVNHPHDLTEGSEIKKVGVIPPVTKPINYGRINLYNHSKDKDAE